VNGRNINVLTTHFDPYTASYRAIQAKDLNSFANGYTQDMILAGDFNEQATNPPMTTIWQQFYDGWAEGKKKGIAYSASDNPNGYTRNSRIDYLTYSRRETHLTLTKITVVDTRNSSGVMPSDHRPILAEFTVN
jgi:endonuclease/exonuclease/phosphatase family metal-dependent hydrolase